MPRAARAVAALHHLARRAEPLVEHKPPSETATLTANYIDWLAKAADTRNIDRRVSFPGRRRPRCCTCCCGMRCCCSCTMARYEWLKERSNFDPALELSLRHHVACRASAAPPPQCLEASS